MGVLWSGTPVASPTLKHATHFQLRTTVYNLTVTRLATYFVRVDGQPLLVHNCKRPPIRIRVGSARMASKAAHSWASRLTNQGYKCSTRGGCGRGDWAHVDWSRGGTAGRSTSAAGG